MIEVPQCMQLLGCMAVPHLVLGLLAPLYSVPGYTLLMARHGGHVFMCLIPARVSLSLSLRYLCIFRSGYAHATPCVRKSEGNLRHHQSLPSTLLETESPLSSATANIRLSDL